MADTEDRVSIELVDAGGHKDRVVMVLSKVKGLTMPPEQLVQHIPCTVATDVPLSLAEKLKGYLEKAGAMVMLEREQVEEEELFSPGEFPIADERNEADALFSSGGDNAGFSSDSEDDLLEFEAAPGPEMGEVPDFEEEDDLIFTTDETAATTDEMVAPPELPEDDDGIDESEFPPESSHQGNIVRTLLTRFSALSKKKVPEMPTEGGEALPAEESGRKKSPLSFLEKFRKGKTVSEKPETGPLEGHPSISGTSERKKSSDFLTSPLAYAVVGLLAGVLIMGTWGWRGIQAERQKQIDYEIQTARQIEEHSAQLKDLVTQRTQEVEALQQQNAALSAELDNFKKQSASIIPTDSPLEMMPWEETLVREFQSVMERHAQILEGGYTAQLEAGCSQQVLLDGNGTMTYAQVVKKFSARYTRYDIHRSNSLVTPYIAEFKIPFQQEIRTGSTQEACQAARLQTFELPPHHEFGGYYGYWTLEYTYEDGEWVLNTTAIERNRDLYESAFKKGSPDYAKFRIDINIFPGLSE